MLEKERCLFLFSTECMAAYMCPSEQEACVVGCNLQATTASLKPGNDVATQIEAQPPSPFGMVQRVVFNLAGHIGRMIRISWSWASSSHSRPISEKTQGRVEDNLIDR